MEAPIYGLLVDCKESSVSDQRDGHNSRARARLGEHTSRGELTAVFGALLAWRVVLFAFSFVSRRNERLLAV